MVPTTISAVEEVPPPSTKTRQTAEQAVVDDLSAGSAVILVRWDDGTERGFEDEKLHGGLLAVLRAHAHGQRVSIVAHELLITPQKAAALLGVSRPMIYRYIESGELHASRVGSHWRLRAGDVVALVKRRAEQATAIDAGFAVALSENFHHRPVDAKRAWAEATDEERQFARELVADLLDLDIGS